MFIRKYPHLELEEDLENQMIEEIRYNFDEADKRTTSYTRMCVRDLIDLVDSCRRVEALQSQLKEAEDKLKIAKEALEKIASMDLDRAKRTIAREALGKIE